MTAMEPSLATAPELSDILMQLSAREPLFHHPEFGIARADFEKMTVEDFWEVGASGRRYGREYVLDAIEKRLAAGLPDIWETKDFYCRELASGVYLLTYTLIQDHTRFTRRSTLWQHDGDNWKALYHQGTLMENGI